MCKPSTDTIKSISKIDFSTLTGDLIDGTVVGMDRLTKVNQTYKFNRVLVIVTDGESIIEGIDDFEAMMDSLKQMIVYIAVIGKVNKDSSNTKKENSKFLQDVATKADGRYMEIADLNEAAQMLTAGNPVIYNDPSVIMFLIFIHDVQVLG